MATTALRGTPVETIGDLPLVGDVAPDFTLATTDLKDVTRPEGKRVVLNIFPSIDTGVCATSVRKFNELAAGLDNVEVICASEDLPFALKRFCGAEGIENVTAASAFRSTFGEDYGVTLTGTGMKGLLARSVVVIDADGTVLHSQLVPEITTEPDYDAALAVLN
ncbi:peroxidase [Intrasporangium chromatireducens Q5-1]|uniref:Thiol peroxidase n=1 Tax=Intrasporangium chromatireducens Q5-1 TaxID=584657 RepID=W9GIM2_9MICO|nr:thiol peroxidase [Intrasporangium chromatireducens]EWT03744.1 peroxidase [Intrasporangium chromatireducens Q5-1]